MSGEGELPGERRSIKDVPVRPIFARPDEIFADIEPTATDVNPATEPPESGQQSEAVPGPFVYDSRALREELARRRRIRRRQGVAAGLICVTGLVAGGMIVTSSDSPPLPDKKAEPAINAEPRPLASPSPALTLVQAQRAAREAKLQDAYAAPSPKRPKKSPQRASKSGRKSKPSTPAAAPAVAAPRAFTPRPAERASSNATNAASSEKSTSPPKRSAKKQPPLSDVEVDGGNDYHQEVTPDSKPDGTLEKAPRAQTSATGGNKFTSTNNGSVAYQATPLFASTGGQSFRG